jgi:hypothetical protein
MFAKNILSYKDAVIGRCIILEQVTNSVDKSSRAFRLLLPVEVLLIFDSL